jgi:hypothetical protein
MANPGQTGFDASEDNGALEALRAAAAAQGAIRPGQTNEDKRERVRGVLSKPKLANHSNRLIAEALGVSHPHVAKIRREMGLPSECLVGKDGKRRRARSSR